MHVGMWGLAVIVIAYTVLARKEERQMVELFGDEYRAYQRRVPMFLPRLESHPIRRYE